MRQFLVTKFVCSSCGKNLNVTYDIPKNSGEYAKGEPTVTDMVQQKVAVEPCVCSIQPLEDMRRAVKVLLGA